jgi:hypothetical protein
MTTPTFTSWFYAHIYIIFLCTQVCIKSDSFNSCYPALDNDHRTAHHVWTQRSLQSQQDYDNTAEICEQFCTMINQCTISLTQLLHCSYVFQHYCVILRELVDSTVLSYKSMSMQSLVIQFKILHVLYCWISILKIFKILKLSYL